jgi:adenylate cyclase
MAEIVAAHGGTIDKFVGDSIMAVWGAPFADPLQASHAVAAAEALLAGIEALNDRLDLSLPDGGALPPVRIGVGVNSGRCAVGRIGSATRRDYTVLGDAVNVAARLVGMTKAYGLDLLIGEATAAQLPASRRRREVDCIAPRGCVERQCVFALTPSEPDPGDGSAAPGSRSLH